MSLPGALAYAGKWLLLAAAVAALAGSASAFFLFALDWAGTTRHAFPWLICLLPLAGFAVGWIYLRYGQEVDGGNKLLLEQIHNPDKVIPLRMAPLVLGATVVSHLFGASVGREGTALQMAGALADQVGRCFRLDARDRSLILMAGLSAGFGSVFGTPLAGAVFGIEVLERGRLRYSGIWPCMLAAYGADQVCLLWGAHHLKYAIGQLPVFGWWPLCATMIAAVLFGLCARNFVLATHALGRWMKQRIAYAPLRPLLGGAVLAATVLLVGGQRYTGLGLDTMVAAFQQPVARHDFLGKMVLTIWSLGTGFKGGEVTPLFFIGATLGNALAPLLQMPVGFLAGLGFVAVFAAAANTPLACTLMAMELFGPGVGLYAALACVVSYMVSGADGIYGAPSARV